jgi:hypothetical protein
VVGHGEADQIPSRWRRSGPGAAGAEGRPWQSRSPRGRTRAPVEEIRRRKLVKQREAEPSQRAAAWSGRRPAGEASVGAGGGGLACELRGNREELVRAYVCCDVDLFPTRLQVYVHVCY